MYNTIDGVRILESETLITGVLTLPRKKSKSKRIQKKYNKKYGLYNYIIPDKKVYLLKDNNLVGHPKTIKKLLEGLDKGFSLNSIVKEM